MNAEKTDTNTMPATPTHITLPVNIYSDLMKWLISKPFQEVAGIVNMLQTNAQGVTFEQAGNNRQEQNEAVDTPAEH